MRFWILYAHIKWELNDTLSNVFGVVLSILVAIEDRVASMERELL